MIDEFNAELDASLRVRRRARRRILAETSSHLAEAQAAGEANGLSPADAADRAVELFGPAALIAESFNDDAARRVVVGRPRIEALIGLAAAGCFLVAVRALTPLPSGPTIAMQILFATAALAGQVALVAMLRSFARTTGGTARSLTTDATFALHRRSSRVFVVAFVVASTCSAGLVALAAARNGLFASGSVIGIVGLVVLAIVSVRFWTDAERPAVTASGHAQPGTGERMLRSVLSRPFVLVGSVAVLAAAGAMVRAETTFSDALPWGVAEAAAVILGYAVLRGVLDLRPADGVTPPLHPR